MLKCRRKKQYLGENPMIVDGYKEIKDTESDTNLIFMWHPPNFSSILSHWHERIEFIYIIEGSLNMVCGSFSKTVFQDDLIVVNANQMHAATSGPNGVKYYALCIDNKPLTEICANLSCSKYILPILQRKRHFQTLIHDKAINAVLLKIITEYEEKKPAYELAVQAGILQLFALLSRYYIDNDSNQIAIDTHFEQVLTYINEHFTENITTESVAEKFAFNKSHFCRKIKSQTGMSFVHYLNQLRMALACSLLSTTDKPITTIAADCGYNDLNYFSRKFHEYYGMTSSAYRKQSKPD